MLCPVAEGMETIQNDCRKLFQFFIHIVDIFKFSEEDIFDVFVQLQVNLELKPQSLELFD